MPEYKDKTANQESYDLFDAVCKLPDGRLDKEMANSFFEARLRKELKQ